VNWNQVDGSTEGDRTQTVAASRPAGQESAAAGDHIRDRRSWRGRNEAGADSAPLVNATRGSAPGYDLFGRPGRSAQRPRQLVDALARQQRDRTTGARMALIDARAPAQVLQPEGVLIWSV
jgi:hypothetical protein